MHLRPTDDEHTIDEVFAAFFSTEVTTDRVRAAESLGHDADLWRRLAETGAHGMAVPEQAGGAGAGLAIAAIAASHVGRTIAPIPLVEHIAATRAIARVDPDHGLLADLIAGGATATLGLDGKLVPAGAVADVVVRSTPEGLTLDQSPPPLTAEPNAAGLPLAYRTSAGSPLGGDGAPMIAEWQALMATALCGLAREALRIGVDYVKEREQFGVAVGTFQAIQHGLADASTQLEGATFLASRAVWALDTQQGDAHTKAAMAFLFAAEAAQQACATALQYHGGYGYAEEYDIQLYYRRARGWALQAGDPALLYRDLADRLLPQAVS